MTFLHCTELLKRFSHFYICWGKSNIYSILCGCCQCSRNMKYSRKWNLRNFYSVWFKNCKSKWTKKQLKWKLDRHKIEKPNEEHVWKYLYNFPKNMMVNIQWIIFSFITYWYRQNAYYWLSSRTSFHIRFFGISCIPLSQCIFFLRFYAIHEIVLIQWW